METANAIEAGLLTLPVFSALSSTELARLAAVTHRTTARKGSMLYTQGDSVTSLRIILGGWIKLSRSAWDGGDVVMDVVPSGHTIGLYDVFGEGHHASTATVAEDAEVLLVPAPELRSVAENNPTFAMGLLREVAALRNNLAQELEGRTLQKAPQRLGCFLLRLIDSPPPQGAVILTIPFDKTLLAARLGMKPETFSRALSSLKADIGLIVDGARVVVRDVPELSTYSCGSCSSAFDSKQGCVHHVA